MTSALQLRLADSVARAQQADDSLAVLHIALGRPASGTPTWDTGEVTTLVVGALRGVLRITDSVVCTDPSEAWVLLPGCDFDGAAGAADRAAAALEDLQPAVGIAIYPDHSSQPTWLTQHAELASDRARMHHSAFAFADATEGEPAGASLIHELPDALRERRLVQHYQPQVELGSRRIVAVEALARWDHPERGLIAPGEFLPLAQVTRLGREVDLEMARQAARQAARWESEGRRIPIAFKLGARTLRWPGLVSALREILDHEGASPQLLKVEVHEEALTVDSMAASVLESLHSLGLSICVESFGGGPASLATVERLPVDELKLDPSLIHFARDPRQVGVLASIVAGGHALGLRVLATHLDTEPLVRSTWGLGCDLGQGFALGSPVTAADVSAETPAVSVPAAAMRPAASAPVLRLPTLPRIRIPVASGAMRLGAAAAMVAAGILAGAIPYGGTTLSATVAGYITSPANAILGTSHTAAPPASTNHGSTGATQANRSGSTGSNGTSSHSGSGTSQSGGSAATGSGSTGTGSKSGGSGGGGSVLPGLLPTPLPSAPVPLPSLPTAP